VSHALLALPDVVSCQLRMFGPQLLVTSHTYEYKANASGRVGLACSDSGGGGGDNPSSTSSAWHASLAGVRVGRLSLSETERG
jgi:hypothetical protein